VKTDTGNRVKRRRDSYWGDWCCGVGPEVLQNPALRNGPEMNPGRKSIELRGVTYT
jgi:hypothetical protein